MASLVNKSEAADDEFPDVLKSDKCTYFKREKLGEGTFGDVLLYKTRGTSEHVAVKFMCKTEGRKELKILKKIRVFDPDENCLVRVLDHFKYNSAICVVFEKLDQDLVDFTTNRKKPFEVCELRPVAQQLMVALKALKSIGVVHCDIKPNNIMLVDQQCSPYQVKLIDFGLAQKKSNLTRHSQIQVLGYRAPEAVFGCPMDEGVDMWSVGCVLAGLYRGQHFYMRACSYDYIASVVHLQGQPPDSVLKKDDSYVKEAQQFMSVCQPTTSVETDAHNTDGKTVCGQNTKVNSTPTSVQDSAVPPVKKTTKKKVLDTFLKRKLNSSVKDKIDQVPHKIVDKTKHTTSKDVADNLTTSSSVSKQVSKKKKMNNKVLKGNTSSGTSETPEESSVKEVNTRTTSFHSKCDKKANKRPPSMEAKTNRETTKGLVDSLRTSLLRGVLRKKNGSNKINSPLVEECPRSATSDFPTNSRNSSGLEILNGFYIGEKPSFVQVKSNKTLLMRARGFFSRVLSRVSI
ncbi:Homeodomain-interacting protein kinase 1 [Oryzias melastigma]|uniref:Homeodomain-interacting protein kinase 1 n=1 Tax=Oryzias melastigma TaxID=30732 RepID=A0A834FM90_ORYME|nr:Homeodomain-interacting protein kinase 1 [Oryzias melastigma]